ncbi:MAG: amidase [Rhodobacteraceae bacterium]|nr:MAG: amidase [Paracoccaceae bacterium]|tara:strand:- start:438 stop:1817 length:1380 start_codon:yes stop_codon:yes gene_type:complete
MATNLQSVQLLIENMNDGSLSLSSMVNSFLKTINDENPTLNAIITQRPEIEIQTDLKVSEARIRENKQRSPLEGFPIAIKDLEDTKGIITTSGSPIFHKNIPQQDSPMVRNLRKAGCLIIGKTNVPEFGVGSQTYNRIFGPTRNPFDSALTAGGSSGGAAAAVSSGMLPFADGSDMMGSLRNPTAFCSVFGFRPSPGVIPSTANSSGLPPLSTLGAIGRSTKCLAYLLDAQIGNFDIKKKNTSRFSQMINQKPKKELRLAWLGNLDGSYAYERGIETVCRKFLESLQLKNVKIDEVSLKFPASKLWESWTTLRSHHLRFDLENHYLNQKTRAKLKPEIIWEIEKGQSLNGESIDKALSYRIDWMTFLHSFFDEYDFFLLPSAQVFPFSVKTPYPTEIEGREMDTYHRWMEVVIPASLAGLPTISIPCGYNPHGLPMGIQLIGGFKDDLKVLATAHFFEK